MLNDSSNGELLKKSWGTQFNQNEQKIRNIGGNYDFYTTKQFKN